MLQRSNFYKGMVLKAQEKKLKCKKSSRSEEKHAQNKE